MSESARTEVDVDSTAGERALGLALAHLNKRDRTVAETLRHLEARGVEEDEAAAAVAYLEREGYLDDQAYARRFAEDRRRLDAWGTERIEQRLRALGIDRELAETAALPVTAGDELSAAVAVLRQRFPVPPDDDRGRQRALGVLIRRGYELELAHEAIRAHTRADP